MSKCNPTISAIVAKAKHEVIGCNGDMPWRMPSDLKYFRRMPMGKPCIMGRKTWESLPFPLKGRANLVLTRQIGLSPEGAEVFHSKQDILERAKEIACSTEKHEVMIIGGGEVYNLFLEDCHKIYITRIEAELDGDTKFPRFAAGKDWELIDRDPLKRHEGDQFKAERKVYKRKRNLFDLPVSSADMVCQSSLTKKLAVI